MTTDEGARRTSELRRVDARFILPQPPTSVRVLGDHPGWREGFVAAGIEAVEEAGCGVDLVVTSPGIPEAFTGDPQMVLLTGRVRRGALRRRGYSVETYLVVQGGVGPLLILPLRRGSRFVAAAVTAAGLSRLRVVLLRAAAAIRIVPPRWRLTLATREPGPPYPVAAAVASLELPTGPDWWCWFGRVVWEHARGCFQLAPRGARDPKWVLKFSRTADDADRFAREEQMLAVAAALPGDLSSHAPRLVARIDTDATQASVETAAPGDPLSSILPPHGTAEQALALADKVTAWIAAMGAATVVPPGQMQPERDRLARDVVARWHATPLPEGLVAALAEVPGVLAHNDIDDQNTVVHRDGFVVIDWETARRAALPLWDLFHFAAIVLSYLGPKAERLDRVLAAFRGESPYSAHLFRWTRAAVTAAQVPPDAVGTIATLCWLEREITERPEIDPAERAVPYRLGEPWLRDPGLGTNWRAWQ